MRTEKQKTEDKNRIIAEFMGAKLTDLPGLQKAIYYPVMGKSVYAHKLKYHSDFNALMPVVAKCLKLASDNELHEWEISISDSLTSCTKSIIFKEIFLFIKWLKKNQIEIMKKITIEEIEDFKEEWGQSHEEICAYLEYDEKGSDEQIMADGYFWMATSNIWLNKSASGFTEREQEIADFLRDTCSIL